MADRITRKRLQVKVDYLSRRLNTNFKIDHYQPGGNPYVWKLQEVRNDGTYHDVTSYRMTIQEFWAYLNGMIDCIDGYATAGV